MQRNFKFERAWSDFTGVGWNCRWAGSGIERSGLVRLWAVERGERTPTWAGSGNSHRSAPLTCSAPHSSSRLWDLDFQMKCKIYFHLKRGLWTTEFFFSTAQVRRFWCCLWFRSGLVALFLKTSERGDSWCTDSSFSPLLVKLSQVFESALLDSILKLPVIPVACAPFPTQILPSSQLCI